MVGSAEMRRHRAHDNSRFALASWSLLTLGVCAASVLRPADHATSQTQKRLDPAAWGSDHVGQPVPEYATGDQCLFCHREMVGPTWSENRHNLTIRDVDDQSQALAALKQSPAKQLADDVKYLLGHQRRQRFLKQAGEYGKFELFSVAWTPPHDNQPGSLTTIESPHWDAKQFGAACAGCHATAVDSKQQTFSSPSLDCYVCHGDVPAEHSNKPELAHLSPRRKEEPRVVTSICAQCHVRTGKSKSTALPYANNFVAGDNLFRDFEVGFSDRELDNLSTADKHVLQNVRDVVLFGNESITCLSCHDIHNRSSKKHQQLADSSYCSNCHNAQGPKSELKPFSNSSKTCVY